MLNKVDEGLRAPFNYDNKGPVSFNGEKVGVDLSSDAFNAAVITVLAAIERGQYLRDSAPFTG